MRTEIPTSKCGICHSGFDFWARVWNSMNLGRRKIKGDWKGHDHHSSNWSTRVFSWWWFLEGNLLTNNSTSTLLCITLEFKSFLLNQTNEYNLGMDQKEKKRSWKFWRWKGSGIKCVKTFKLHLKRNHQFRAKFAF